MKIKNKLKAVSIASFCLVVSLWSETQGTDKQNDILESATVNCTTIQPVSQSEINDLAFEIKPSQLINLEDSIPSWASYLLSPAKAVIQSSYKVINFTTQNPQKAIIIGVCLAYQFMAVAADCNCIGYSLDSGQRLYIGTYSNETTCSKALSSIPGNWVLSICLDRN